MRDKIFKMAVLYPHQYPWKERLENISSQELNIILKNEGIFNEFERRKVGWNIEILLYKFAEDVNSVEELINKICDEYLDLGITSSIPPASLIHGYVSRKDLNTDKKLKLYKEMISGKLQYSKDRKINLMFEGWTFDLLMYYCILSEEDYKLNKETIIRFVHENVVKLKHIKIENSKFIEKRAAVQGFKSRKNILDFKTMLKDKTNILKNLTRNIIDLSDDEYVKNDILDDLLDMVNDIDLGDIGEESREKDVKEDIDTDTVEKEEKEEKENGSLDKLVDDFIEKLRESADELVNEVDKTCSQSHDDFNDLELKFIKKLVDPSKGAVLSQLYEVYQNIENTDISNVKAALADFFNYLMVNGVIPAEYEKKMGEKVKVNSSELLKKYRSISPVEDESFDAIVKYPAWEYSGKVIMQPIIKPIKK